MSEELESGVIDGDGPQGGITGGELILLVEEEDPFRSFGARALRSKGYKVVEAQTGEAAIEILRGASFDLFITDMAMPKIGGAEVIKAARSGDPDLPVICISGYTQESTAREVESMENVDFLPKLFSLKQLAAIVKVSLDRSREATAKSELTN